MTEEREAYQSDFGIRYIFIYLFFKCIKNQPWTKFNVCYYVKTYAVTSSREEQVTSKTFFFLLDDGYYFAIFFTLVWLNPGGC